MATEFYLGYCDGGTEFSVDQRAFVTAEARLQTAQAIFKNPRGHDFDPDEGNLFWLDIEDGKPVIGSFTSSEIEGE